VPTQRMIRFLGYWYRALFYGVASAVFSYGSPIAALIVGIFFTSGPLKLDQSRPWVIVIASVALAYLVAFTIHSFIGLFRAWNMLHPFTFEVVSGQLETQYPKGEHDPQIVAVRIKNRSYLTRHDCVVHIMNVEGIDNRSHIFPRFIEKLSIDSRETKQIPLMCRAFRFVPFANDIGITLAGPVSPHGTPILYVFLPIGVIMCLSELVSLK
jgi:hypothetical protein